MSKRWLSEQQTCGCGSFRRAYPVPYQPRLCWQSHSMHRSFWPACSTVWTLFCPTQHGKAEDGSHHSSFLWNDGSVRVGSYKILIDPGQSPAKSCKFASFHGAVLLFSEPGLGRRAALWMCQPFDDCPSGCCAFCLHTWYGCHLYLWWADHWGKICFNTNSESFPESIPEDNVVFKNKKVSVEDIKRGPQYSTVGHMLPPAPRTSLLIELPTPMLCFLYFSDKEEQNSSLLILGY